MKHISSMHLFLSLFFVEETVEINRSISLTVRYFLVFMVIFIFFHFPNNNLTL